MSQEPPFDRDRLLIPLEDSNSIAGPMVRVGFPRRVRLRPVTPEESAWIAKNWPEVQKMLDARKGGKDGKK